MRAETVTVGGVEQRAAKVSSVTALSTFVTIAFQLVSVPICLRYWGKETYGSWLALYAAFMLIRSLDGGFVVYVGNELNVLYHRDQVALRLHLASAVVGILILAALELSVSVAAIFSHATVTILGVTSPSSSHAAVNLALPILVVAWICSGSYLGIVHRLLIPSGMMYQAAWWSMGFQAIQFFALIFAALLHLDVVETSVLFALAQVSVYLASAIYVRRKLPRFYPWWRGSHRPTGLADLARSTWLTASSLIQQGSVNGAVMLVSALSGPLSVPVFTTVRTLANLWTNVTNVLATPLLPDVVRYHAVGDGQKLVSVTEAYWVLVGTAVNLGVLLTYPAIRPLYGYWTAHAVPLDDRLLPLMLGSILIANIGGLISVYIAGINSVRVVLASAVLRAILSLGLGSVLFFRVGLSGFGIGILAGELCALLLGIYYFVRRALPRQGVLLGIENLSPAMLSTISALAFLIAEAFHSSTAVYLYPFSIFGVAMAAAWGWSRLGQEVRARLNRMIHLRLGRQTALN